MTIYFQLLLFVHILLVGVLIGSAAALYLLWRQSGDGDDDENPFKRVAMLDISRRATTMAGGGAVLVGILMLMENHELFIGSGLFRAKVTLGLILVGLVFALHSHLRNLERQVGDREIVAGSVNRLLRMIVILAPVVLLMGIFAGH